MKWDWIDKIKLGLEFRLKPKKRSPESKRNAQIGECLQAMEQEKI